MFNTVKKFGAVAAPMTHTTIKTATKAMTRAELSRAIRAIKLGLAVGVFIVISGFIMHARFIKRVGYLSQNRRRGQVF